MLAQLVVNIINYFKTHDQTRLSHIEFQKYLNILRLFVLATFCTRYVFYYSQMTSTVDAYIDRRSVLFSLGACYLLMIVISYVLLLSTPLIALRTGFHELQAYLELVGLTIAIGFTQHLGTHLTLFFFVPFLVLIRVKSRNWKYIVILVASTLISTSLVLQITVGSEQLNATPSALVDFAIMVLIIYMLSRGWRNGRSRLGEANFDFALNWIQKKYGADLGFLRINVPEKHQSSLILVSSIPESHIDERHAYNFSRLNSDEQFSIATLAFADGVYKTITGRHKLTDKLYFKGIVDAYKLKSGIAFPLIARSGNEQPHGTISLYWSKPEGYKDSIYSLQSDVKQIQGYINEESDAAVKLAEEIATIHIHQAESARLNYWLEQIQEHTDLWETADLISMAASELSGYETAFLLFWDEEVNRYVLQIPHGFHSEIPHESFGAPKIGKISNGKFHPFNLLALEPQWAKTTAFAHCLAFPLHSADKTLGLLVIGTTVDTRLSLGTQELILTLARHSAVDLRNCQLLNKANTTADMAQALSSMIHDLFTPSEISEDDRDLYLSIAEIIQKAVKAHSCSFGLLRLDSEKLDAKTFATTARVVDSHLEINCPDTLNLIEKAIKSERGIHQQDYSSLALSSRQFAGLFHLKRTYTIAVELDEGYSGIIFINYDEVTPRTEYQINQVFPMIQQHIPKAWKAWQAWHKAQTHQKQIWKYDIHDQLNEVQFNITLPLEQLQYAVEKNGTDPHLDDIQKIHKSARSVWTTLKHIMDDMRHPVILDEGLIPAIRYLERRYPGLQVDVECLSGEPPSAVANPIYRLAREAIHNGFKHGGSEVRISIESHQGCFKMTVADNGPGINLNINHGAGMTLMQYQAALIDANLEWGLHEKARGTTVEFEWQEKS